MVRPLEHVVENWGSASTWCSLAEVAAVAGDTALATEMAAKLRPLSGRIALSGISSVQGPNDGYLALALATCGEREEASEAAQRGLTQAEEWGFTAYAEWLRGRRAQLGF